MLNYFPALRLLVFVLALTFASSAIAQSGRRVTKKAPAPVPMPGAPAAPVKPADKPKPALTLVVGMERPDYFGSTSVGNTLLSFVDRLNEHPSVKVDVIHRDYTRGEAVQRAKSEKEAYVVVIELRSDSRTMSNADEAQFRVVYWVFSPGTAKLKTSGQTYPQVYRNKGVILSPRAPGVYGDYRLQQAAREAADRVLDAFNLHPPDTRSSIKQS